MGVPGKTVGVMFTPLTVKYVYYDTERIGGKNTKLSEDDSLETNTLPLNVCDCEIVFVTNCLRGKSVLYCKNKSALKHVHNLSLPLHASCFSTST